MPEKKTIALDPENPDPDIINRAGKILENKGVVIFPAQCLYGVAVNAFSQTALQKVFSLKKRPLAKPLLVLIPHRNMLPELVLSIPGTAKKLMETFWPGRLTLILEARDHIPSILTADTGKIGVRLPYHPVAKALVKKTGFPITGTSANLSGQESCSRIDRLSPDILKRADLILDAGRLKGGTGSTIVDATGSQLKILRHGEISPQDIHRTAMD